jgi:hypothetical protein
VDLVTASWLLLGSPTWKKILERKVRALALPRCPSCGDFWPRDGEDKCRCGEARCRDCGERHHMPATCSSYKLAVDLARQDYRWKLEVEVRPCPKCGECWEKSHGCNHMRCASCREDFCWGCGRQGRLHHGGYCGSLTVPLDTRAFFTSFMGLSEKRLEALQRGNNRLKHEEANKDKQSCGCQVCRTPIQVNPHQVAREVWKKSEPDQYFHHTRRYRNDLEQLPEFGTVEKAVKQSVSTLHRAKNFIKFGFFLEQSEAMENQLLLERLERVMEQLELHVSGTREGKSAGAWKARLKALTRSLNQKMTRITLMHVN